MNPTLHIYSSGFLTTIQDLGRVGYQHLGVSVSGALDPVSACAANALVGNLPAAGVVEVMYTGPTLVVDADSARLAFVGATAPIELLPSENAQNGSRIEGGRTIRLRRGEAVRIGSLSGASVMYVAVEGGFAIDPVLGSVSTYLRAGFGGWQGRALVAGDRLPLNQNTATNRTESRIEGLNLDPPLRFRAIRGPQCDYFPAGAIAKFFASEYTVGPDSDRMGMRLNGNSIEHLHGFDIISDGIAPGSIQVPGSGQPIVLLADRQTTGGYPKIATIISADLPALGRLRIGTKIAFEEVDLEEAYCLRRKFLFEFNRISDRIVSLSEDNVTTQLHEANLISGAVNIIDWI
jgi:biotin-dependent carboxylase-like uncharacterized protein